MNWVDAFGRKLQVGSRVTYPRQPREGGGVIYVVATIVGPANLGGDQCVIVDLTDATLALLNDSVSTRARAASGLTKPVKKRVPSVNMRSLILIDDDVDVVKGSSDETGS